MQGWIEDIYSGKFTTYALQADGVGYRMLSTLTWNYWPAGTWIWRSGQLERSGHYSLIHLFHFGKKPGARFKLGNTRVLYGALLNIAQQH